MLEDTANARPELATRCRRPYAIRLHCMVLLLLLSTEVVMVWLRPILFTTLYQAKEALSFELKEMMDRKPKVPNNTSSDTWALTIRAKKLSEVVWYCRIGQLACFVPLLFSVFIVTTKDRLTLRYLALLAGAIPLALGFYRQELADFNITLLAAGDFLNQLVVVALSTYVLSLNGVNDWQRCSTAVSAVPITFFVATIVQGNITSVAFMNITATIATVVFSVCAGFYCRVCFCRIGPVLSQ
ncbi:MAG: hypothetical protein JNM43_21820 [Planctomycetaceae bacterium]|nr:hypothetical protein [Planctomycetaceae bacterium]